MSAVIRRKNLRRFMAGTACLEPASVFDPISGRLAEELGFECGLLGGSSAAMAVLAAPDIALVTLTEFCDHARRICRACVNLPLIVDADHGFGNALSVKRTIEDLEAAGVAAISIEDTLFPMPYGGYRGSKLTSIPEAVGKLAAALAARSDPDLFVCGRTVASACATEEELLERVRAYQDTGVDGLFLVYIQSRETLERIAKIARVPIIIGGYPPELANPNYLASVGVRLYAQKHDTLLNSIGAIKAALEDRRAGVENSFEQETRMMRRISQSEKYERLSELYLGDTGPSRKWR